MRVPDVSLSASARNAVVEDVVETIRRHYLFPDAAAHVLDLWWFYDPDLGAETTAAAMRLVAHTAALIVALRRNGGGDPGHVALLCSYLLGPAPVHLWDFRWRAEGRVEQTWTVPDLPGPRYLDRPVYLLTSRQTVSGGESFSYTLKNQGRATVVGETTRGAAYYADEFLIQGTFGLAVSTAQPIDAVTGTNWEGTGVIPDVAVPAEEALATAHAAALRAVLPALGESTDRASRELREEAWDALKASLEK